MAAKAKSPQGVATGIEGLDSILRGGLPGAGVYVLRGGPGTGKTTTGLQFLLEGQRNGERSLFLALGQSRRQVERVAASHGWTLDEGLVQELSVDELTQSVAPRQTVLPASEVGLSALIDHIRQVIEQHRPDRVVIDSFSLVRQLAGAPIQYRREVVKLRQFLDDLGCTTLLLDVVPLARHDDELEALADGLIQVEQLRPDYGGQRFRMLIVKMRALPFRGGYHDFAICRGGLEVFPRVIPLPEEQGITWQPVESGVRELDAMLGGGLMTGTACMMLGPTGVGKSTLCALYAHRAAQRGEKSAVFLFEERKETYFRRTRELGMDIEAQVASGHVSVSRFEAGGFSPGEFSNSVRGEIDSGARVLVIDSLTGYYAIQPQENMLHSQMHDLLAYLSQKDVLTLFTVEQRGIIGDTLAIPLNVSDLADTVLLLRHFEDGGIRQAFSIIKRRHGWHDKGIWELTITPDGVRLSDTIDADRRVFGRIGD